MTRLLLILLLLAGCAPSEDGQVRGYYRIQLRDRMDALRAAESPDTTTASELHREVEKIILVSKDAENPEAAIALCKSVFDRFCERHSLDRKDFPDLKRGMELDEMELQLRENELAFLNRLVMSDTTSAAKMFTAH
jgi:hypothetical protein